ncbi:VIT1/CCC1 transporter family protein [Demequina aurantiaca]|uniref:VIT1/CCC1 transporter family protein n=1 Tax=Demequina aurantiaca TaxID=676200 RepID=UPI0009FF0AE2|nr:VIT family protein [Demequina aurantiaca]
MTKHERHKEHYTGPDEVAISSRMNWLRAGVLGANDGIVSMAALLVGVAAAAPSEGALLTAGIAGISAGALSMGIGEYVSVSSQRDAEKAQIEREKIWQDTRPEWELQQLVELNKKTGMSEEVATVAAAEQMDHDALAIHALMHLGIDPDEFTNPWVAGFASLVAFTVGGMIPTLTILLAPESWAIPATFVAVIVALAITGLSSARVAHSSKRKALVRNVVGGTLAMLVTYGIGDLLGTHVL